jgi:hypothetical protein
MCQTCNGKAIIAATDEGEPYWYDGGLMTMKARPAQTGGSISMIDVLVPSSSRWPWALRHAPKTLTGSLRDQSARRSAGSPLCSASSASYSAVLTHARKSSWSVMPSGCSRRSVDACVPHCACARIVDNRMSAAIGVDGLQIMSGSPDVGRAIQPSVAARSRWLAVW